uniref:Type-4 ice-structuring protein LS-12-like n=1 Tax=Acanthochromis polyacanthus TaxID=80966 RepID=A0A3Q1GK09_9TELE
MKFSLIAAVVVLALAQGSFAQDASDLEKLTTYFEEVKNTMTAKMTELMNHQDVANHADNIRTQLEPLTAKLRETVTNLQAQAQPVVENLQKQMEAILQNQLPKDSNLPPQHHLLSWAELTELLVSEGWPEFREPKMCFSACLR